MSNKMQMTVFYELPLDGEKAQDVIEKAREVGYPLLAVVVEAEANPNRAVGGFNLGRKVGELDQEMATIGGEGHIAESFEVLKEAT